MPPTQTSCPLQGQARAAVTAPLTLGSNQNIVYVYNTSTTAFLRRYDVTTGQKTTIVSLSSVKISDAQVSTDGQYVLFVSQVSGHPAIQMIRMDGQGLQTLYCAYPNNGIPPALNDLLWSPNQQLAVFLEPDPNGGPAGPDIRLLNLTAGTVQTKVIGGMHSQYILETWRNNTQVYFTIYTPAIDTPQNNVYVLDLTKGTNNTTEVAQIDGAGWDMNLTPDGNTLVLSQDAPNSQPPSLISSQPATGGILNVIYASHVHAVTQARIISSTTLLFILGGKFGIDPAPGLWKMG
jgi:dipeptidyl aminopeptidase/acylaminoacyl peptidase